MVVWAHERLFSSARRAATTPCGLSGQRGARRRARRSNGAGNLYGTTFVGGANGLGTVFNLGPAQAPMVAFNPPSLSFNNVVLNMRSPAETVTVTNTGNSDLTFGSGAVTLTGTNKADFDITSDGCSSQTIGFTAPANTCSVSLTFTPSTTSATESASLSFADNAPAARRRWT